jgi:predicted nucleic acid-binding protein
MSTPIHPLLIDSDVLIQYLRGRPEAIAYLNGLTSPISISVISVAELYSGVRDGADRSKLDAFVTTFSVIPVDLDIAVLGGVYRRDYGRIHGTGRADALIAATADLGSLTLVTLNIRHFPMFPGLSAPC